MIEVAIHESTADEKVHPEESAKEVIEHVNEILGYDVLVGTPSPEGYREMAEEMLGLAETNLHAANEALPED